MKKIETKNLTPIESKLKYNSEEVKKARDIVKSTLDVNKKTVKDFQEKLSNLLEKKGYEKFKADGYFGGQSLEAVKLFLNKYEGKNIQDFKKNLLKNLNDAMTGVDVENRKLKKAEEEKQKQKFKEAAKKAPKKEVKKAQQEIENTDKQEQQEKQEVIKDTKGQLDNHKNKVERTLLNNNLLKQYFITNNKGEQVPVNIEKNMDKDFNIETGKNKLSFTGKTPDLPVEFDIDINSREKKVRNNHNKYKKEYIYSMSLDLKKQNGVNYYKVDSKTGKDLNQIYYSYTKGKNHYIGVLGFNFDDNNGEVKNYKHITKQVDHKFSKDELEKYQDAMYDSGILDTGKHIEDDTIVSYNNVDVATEEKTYKELSKKYKNKNALDGALQLLGADILADDNLKQYFNIGAFDKEGIGTGDILGLLIEKKGITESGLDGKLGKYYKLIKNGFISPYEIKNFGKDISKYPNVENLNGKQKLKFFTDFDDSGEIGDNTQMIWGEMEIYDMMKGLSETTINKKINEIAKLGGLQETNVSPYVKKVFFWRGVNMLPVNGDELKQYLTGKKTLGEIKKASYEKQRKTREDLLNKIFENNPKLKAEFEKAKTKAFKKLINQLPDNLKDNQDLIDRIRAGVNYVGANALYVSNEGKHDTYGVALNYKVDWKIFDHLSLGFASIGGHIIPGISLSKSFTHTSEDGKTKTGITGALVNGIIPIVSVSASHNFETNKLEDWTRTSKTVLTSIGTAFPVLFGSLGYNFGHAEEIETKNNKMGKILDNMLFHDLKNGKLDLKNYSGMEKQIASSINMILKQMPMKGWPAEAKKQVLGEIKQSFLNNYKNLNINSNTGTHLSEIGLIWAMIPLPYAKWENIKAKYTLDKNSPKHILESVNSGNLETKQIQNKEGLKKYLKNVDGVSFDGKYIVIDENKLPNGTMIGIDPKLEIKKTKDGKILVGGDLNSIKIPKLSAAGKHANMIIFGNALGQTLKNDVYMKNFLGKDKNGNIKDNIAYTNTLKPLSLGGGAETYIKENKEFKEIKDNFKNSELYKNITDSIDGRIITSNKKFAEQYGKLVRLDQNYDYDKALKHIRKPMLAKKSPLYLFISHRLGQKKLDKIRKDIDTVLSSKDKNKVLKEKIIVETFLAQFFSDMNIEQKKGKDIGDKNTQKYMRSLSMESFETKNLAGDWKYNRSAGFARSLRDEIFGKKYSTFEGHLVIKGEKDMKRVLSEANDFISKNKLPDWAINKNNKLKLSQDQKEKLGTFYRIILTNDKYINAEDKNHNKYFDKPTYKTAEAEDIIAFPFTYKLGVDEHGHVPISGMVDLVDIDGDGKITENDYEKIKETKGLKEYMFDMLSPRVKDSLKNLVETVYGVSIKNNDELKQLFVQKNLTKGEKTISIDYDIALAKRAQCFNSTLILKDLKIGGNIAGISVSSGEIYLKNEVRAKVENYGGAVSRTGEGKKGNVKNNSESQTTPGEKEKLGSKKGTTTISGSSGKQSGGGGFKPH